MQFDCKVECLVTCGNALSISHTPTVELGSEYFVQCVVKNVSPIPLQLLPCRPAVAESAATRMKHALVLAPLTERGAGGDGGGGTDASAVIPLAPGERYMVGLRVAYRRKQEEKASLQVSKNNNSQSINRLKNTSTDKLNQSSPPSSSSLSAVEPFQLELVDNLSVLFPFKRVPTHKEASDTDAATADVAVSDITALLFSDGVFVTQILIDKPKPIHNLNAIQYSVAVAMTTISSVPTSPASDAGHNDSTVAGASVGQLLRCKYLLKGLFSSSVRDSSKYNVLGARLSVTCLSSEVWAILGRTKRFVTMDRQQQQQQQSVGATVGIARVEEGVEVVFQMIPLVCGVLKFPPLQVNTVLLLNSIILCNGVSDSIFGADKYIP